jgi:magnesium-transporting ATPase (P-type)
LHLLSYLPSNHNWPKYRGWEIRSSLQNIKETPTPLQIQIQKFVKVMAIMVLLFLLVWVFIFENAQPLTSLLKDSHSQCQFPKKYLLHLLLSWP